MSIAIGRSDFRVWKQGSSASTCAISTISRSAYPVANAMPGSFSDVFSFSVETLATVGYGAMALATLYGYIVSAVEIVT